MTEQVKKLITKLLNELNQFVAAARAHAIEPDAHSAFPPMFTMVDVKGSALQITCEGMKKALEWQGWVDLSDEMVTAKAPYRTSQGNDSRNSSRGCSTTRPKASRRKAVTPPRGV